MDRSARVVSTLSQADPQFAQLCELLYGGLDPDAVYADVFAKASPDQIEVALEDDGSGMADNILPKIFEPFFSTRPAGEGTGLGLTIAHKIITGMGGTIRVKTTPRQGSVFTVTLPVGAAAAEAADVR